MHNYSLVKTPGGNTAVTCSDCGPQGNFPDGEAVQAHVQLHDRDHAIERHACLPHQGDIDAWLWGPGADRTDPWEPSAAERAGLVSVPLGYVCIDAAIARALDLHDCPARRRAHGYDRADTDVTLRILDVNGRASDHVLDAFTALDLGCIIEELIADDRVNRAWYVRPRTEVAS